MTLPFTKMNGAGNDFIIIDNRELSYHLSKQQIARLCDRNRGIGADGFLAVEPTRNDADFRYRYYNADGGEAEMCGNGARCYAKFAASLLGTESPPSVITFETMAGILSAEFIGSQVRIMMSDPVDLELKVPINNSEVVSDVHRINTGVPHTVSFLPDLSRVNVQGLGSLIRHHELFASEGTNVNFAQILSPQHLKVRTYERGVEDETLACGTGITACALIHHLLTQAPSPIQIEAAGGDMLEVHFEVEHGLFHSITLTGPAETVFSGTITL